MSICNDPVKVHVWYICVFCGMTHMYTERVTVVLQHHANYHQVWIFLPRHRFQRVYVHGCLDHTADVKQRELLQNTNQAKQDLFSRLRCGPASTDYRRAPQQVCIATNVATKDALDSCWKVYACSYRIYCTYLVMEIHLWLLVYGLVGPLSQGTNSRRIGRFLCLYLWLYHVVSVYHHTGPRVSPTSWFGNDRNDSWLRHDWNFAHQAVETETQICQEYWNVLNY